MWPRSVSRFRGVLIGIAIGSGAAGLLVAWTIEGIYMTTAKQRIRPGKKMNFHCTSKRRHCVDMFRVRLYYRLLLYIRLTLKNVIGREHSINSQ